MTNERNCIFCGEPFVPTIGKQIYCSTACRYRQAHQMEYERKKARRDG